MSPSELHLLYVLGTILSMLGLTEHPAIASCALTPRFSGGDQRGPLQPVVSPLPCPTLGTRTTLRPSARRAFGIP